MIKTKKRGCRGAHDEIRSCYAIFAIVLLQLFVKCLSFDDYNLKKGELANYNSSMNNKFSKPMALPKGASFTLCVTVKTTDIGSSYYRKFDADLLRTNLDTYCKKSDVFQSIQIRAERAPVFIKSFNYTIKN